MKLNKLVVACSVLFAAGAGTQAFATGPSNTVQLLVSGASALEISTQKAVADMCNQGALSADPLNASHRVFYKSANGNAYRCVSRTDVSNSKPFATAHTMDIRKRNGGGSSFGVVQVAAATPVGFTDPNSSSCVAAANVTFGGLTWLQRTSCGEVNLAPDAGVSDVEPALFGNPPGLAPPVSIVAQVFGIPVNDKLYRKLQAVQGLSDINATTFDPLKAPSLTYAQVRSLFTGSYNDWKLVNAGITHAGNGSTFAKICRRVVTSGTQATINALFLNNPCGAGPFGGQLLPASNEGDGHEGTNDTAATQGLFLPTAGDVYTVVMNSGAGQVDACLTDANVDGELAIGLLGTERISGATPSDDADGIPDQWHYVKLSGGVQTQQLNTPAGPGLTASDDDHPVEAGSYPSVDNTIASTYDLYAEATFNTRPLSTYSVDKQALMAKLPVLMGDPATIRSENLLGLAALPTNGYDPTLAANYPTLKGSRFGNTCQPTTLQY